MLVISRIEAVGGGWVARWQEGGGGGGWEAEGGLKQPFRLKQQCYAFSMMGPELVQFTGWVKTAVRSSLVPHAVLLMPLKAEKCILVVSQHR